MARPKLYFHLLGPPGTEPIWDTDGTWLANDLHKHAALVARVHVQSFGRDPRKPYDWPKWKVLVSTGLVGEELAEFGISELLRGEKSMAETSTDEFVAAFRFVRDDAAAGRSTLHRTVGGQYYRIDPPTKVIDARRERHATARMVDDDRVELTEKAARDWVAQKVSEIFATD